MLLKWELSYGYSKRDEFRYYSSAGNYEIVGDYRGGVVIVRKCGGHNDWDKDLAVAKTIEEGKLICEVDYLNRIKGIDKIKDLIFKKEKRWKDDERYPGYISVETGVMGIKYAVGRARGWRDGYEGYMYMEADRIEDMYCVVYECEGIEEAKRGCMEHFKECILNALDIKNA